MTANKMPEMPEAVGYVGSDMTGRIGVVLPAGTFLYTADQVQEYGNGRHDEGYADGYLAGLEAAKACVPDRVSGWREWGKGFNDCCDRTLTNLTALEQGVGK